jgi:hypothetical protein
MVGKKENERLLTAVAKCSNAQNYPIMSQKLPCWGNVSLSLRSCMALGAVFLRPSCT